MNQGRVRQTPEYETVLAIVTFVVVLIIFAITIYVAYLGFQRITVQVTEIQDDLTTTAVAVCETINDPANSTLLGAFPPATVQSIKSTCQTITSA